ncbi:MAG: two-component regulator propeller domain-containing protein, partial [Chitinophagaceae bacterium]
SLNNNSVYAIYKDTKSNMWLGTFNGGVDMVNADGNKFAHYKHILSRNSLSNNNVLCIYEDSRKNIWIGTDGGGLNLFDPLTGKFVCFKNEKNNKNSICGNYVLSVCEDRKGNIWVGTWGSGVTVFNKEMNIFRHFKNEPANPNSLSSNNAWKIFQDKDANIWVGTYGGGLNMFDGDKTFTRFQSDANNKSSISSNNVQSILEDENGELWITTDGGGINKFDKRTKAFTSFLHDDTKNSLADNKAGSIYLDSDKNLWICTMAGLSFMDKRTGQFTNYTTADGLPNNVIFGILEDRRHQLWVSTNKGISKFDRSKKTFKNFDITDGLQANEFKQQAYCKSHTGKMYFGGINGFNEFFPDSIKENSFVPPLVITGFQIFNKEVAIATNDEGESPLRSSITETKDITISHKSSVISFEFASLNYTIAEKKQYEYMLEGFDQKWNNIGTRRTATYTNLDPGKYVFKVRGLNNDGTWSEAVTSLSLTIEPPFWLTWWFKTLAALVVIGSVLMVFRVRVKVITKQKVRLQQKVKERTDEVERQKEKLSANVLELEEAQKQTSSQMKELAVLKESLEKEKYYLDSLMDNMPDSIYFKDKDSKLMRVSKYMANHFGMSVEELIGKSDFDFQSEIHAKEAFEDEQTIQRTKTPKIDYIEKETGADGSEIWVTTTKMPLMNSKGEVVGTYGMSRDITKAKELEKEQHAAEMDKAVAQGKFEIASDVMHDIGNAVVGFGSYITRIRRVQEQDKPENMIALTRFFEENKPAITTVIGEAKASAVIKMLVGIALTQRTNQEEISKSISEQLNIITHIQEILNIQRQYISGHESQERKPVNLRTVINDSISMVYASIDKMAISVSLNMSLDLPIIKGDRTKLMQAILNILKNSIESIDKDADKKVISLDAYVRANELVLQIKDSGNGFDKSTADQLFRRGFSTKTSASGFGLYNCKSIIESHEGKIEIMSDGPGKGTLTTIGFKLSA